MNSIATAIAMLFNPAVKQNTFRNLHQPKLNFGGSLLGETTNPKTKRPLSSKLPIHLVLRANRSWMRTPKHFAKVNETLKTVARRHGVRVYEFANVGNHLHVLLRITKRPRWAAFIRELCGRLASQAGGGGVWARRPFTRVVSGWTKAYASVKEYVRLNTFEVENRLSALERAVLRELRSIWGIGDPAWILDVMRRT